MDNDWIEHDGKGMPVDGETKVNVRFRDGDVDATATAASYWYVIGDPESNWFHLNDWADITHYQIVTEDKEPQK